jgi:hydroxyquinol 1,2-dioxygenase
MRNANEENLTDAVLEKLKGATDPRFKEIMSSLIRHLHAFIRETELTEKEWITGIQFLTATGQKCDAKRQEYILLSDTLGVSMLVDAINHRKPGGATETTVLGPFYVSGAKDMPMWADIAGDAPGEPAYISGRVLDVNGKPVAGAVLDVWQTDGEGLYEAQVEGAEGYMRGIYHSKADGTYVVNTVAPIGYTIPLDGTVGELFGKTTISPYRPAHIHFLLDAPGYHRCTTHLFQKGDQYIETDVVYGVKEPLIVQFDKKPAGTKAPNGETMKQPFYVVNYDFTLQKLAQAKAA